MKPTRTLSLIVLLLYTTARAQTIHQIPFGSAGNSIELTIANALSIPSAVTVEATSVPSWLHFAETKRIIKQLNPYEELPALFSFSVDKSAPVNRPQTVTFNITSSSGQVWTKEIGLSVGSPERVELFQNYPNPFNPTTAISYQLSVDSRVSLKIFNLLGQEVVTLFEGEKPAGYHQETWNASTFSSGFYLYQLLVTDAAGNRSLSRKAMMLIR